MKTYQRRLRKPKAEINVVPYIDVSLVLLTIFMITAPLLQSSVEVNLPQVEQTQATTLPDDVAHPPITITLKKDQQLFIEAEGRDAQPVTRDELVERVALAHGRDPVARILVRGDRDVNYGGVIDVFMALKQAQIGVPVNLLTRPSGQ